MTRHSSRSLAISCAIFVLLMSVRSYAGGPLILFAPGVPYLWPAGGVNIPFNPDQGGLGPLNNAAAVAQTTAAFAAWEAVPSSTVTHLNGGQLSVDVDETNFMPFFNPTAPDGLSAIVYDEDGAIFNLLFGPNSGVLGFAGPEWINTTTGEIIEGVSFMNGGALLGPNPFPVAEMLSVQVHEFGHYQNLAHTVVNGQIAGFGDHRGPSPFNTFPPISFAGRIETMYPFLFVNGGQATPHADDIAMISHLYPEPGFAGSTGTITGLILAPNNTLRLTGVNVIARNVANPYDDAVSAISSDFTDNFNQANPLVGRYTLRGLTPGGSYAVYVDQILAGGFSTPPRTLPGPEEFYNGASESNDSATDDPSMFTPIAAAAGVTASGINIIFNRRLPGPIAAGDDTVTEIFPNDRIRFCGQTYDSFFINSNGSVTFGVGSTAFGESAAAMLTGPPRIAGLWDDLNAAAGGTVSWEETNRTVTVRWDAVPEFNVPANVNTFAITMNKKTNSGHHGDDDDDDWWSGGSSNRFKLEYGALAATDGLAGFSCGGRVTSGFEQETDLTRLLPRTINGQHEAAIFEVFTTDNDLDNRRFEFLGPRGFRDEFEPNDSAAGQNDRHGDDCDDDRHGDHLVRLPFNTANKYSEIDPDGGDVDFYRFRARAGDILIIETVPGLQTMDSLIGLFDADGNLLLADDDSGVGILSKLAVQILVDGVYAVGVTTFPDFDFTGAGGDFGRYVLQINRYRGTIVPATDDGAVEVPIPFGFRFQGQTWNSVFVNGNGNLTFGAPNADFSETVPELLSGPPRIAPLWDDLTPNNGFVIVESNDDSLSIHFAAVPEFLVTGTNYFSVELERSGDIELKYYATNRSDGIVGVTEGGGAADPGPADLSRAHRLSAGGTTYQSFVGSFGTYGGVDLSFGDLTFKKPRN
jgi:hypothetical protein